MVIYNAVKFLRSVKQTALRSWFDPRKFVKAECHRVSRYIKPAGLLLITEVKNEREYYKRYKKSGIGT